MTRFRLRAEGFSVRGRTVPHGAARRVGSSGVDVGAALGSLEAGGWHGLVCEAVASETGVAAPGSVALQHTTDCRRSAFGGCHTTRAAHAPGEPPGVSHTLRPPLRLAESRERSRAGQERNSGTRNVRSGEVVVDGHWPGRANAGVDPRTATSSPPGSPRNWKCFVPHRRKLYDSAAAAGLPMDEAQMIKAFPDGCVDPRSVSCDPLTRSYPASVRVGRPGSAAPPTAASPSSALRRR